MSTSTIPSSPVSLHDPRPSSHASQIVSAKLALVAPRHSHDPDWPWITRFAPANRWSFDRLYIDNVYEPFPKATCLYRLFQYVQAAQWIKTVDVAFLFSTDIGIGLTNRLKRSKQRPRLVYVGFTQDAPWQARRVRKLARALQLCDVVSIFTEQERQVYIDRYGLAPQQAVVIPIHTDETDDYCQYGDVSPEDKPFALALGSPNRRFTPTARICKALGVPLVIVTRPWHKLDSLDELRSLGVKVITDADKLKALTYLKHARLAVMPFDDPSIAGGYTTIIHAMFLRTPMVATNCLGIPEHIIDGETGYVTEHGDDDALQAAIDRLWSESGLAQQLGDAAEARAQGRHSLKAAARQFAQLTQKLLQSRA